ncbi:DEAD/DEAH box helicase [Paraburkholderia hospita]|uniref:DEAD/DEAH box helicase n=1 Tax=Paraburkholderia hospita TaxID=169430 RepID=A0ABN0FNT2_9BURK|nr:DEAD/DEAH box helicase [Paraburkholderia hospita]EIN00452.1 DEAD/DEAH box helicase [Paraburkholderia hospita]OUL88458.1 DEAD/DEAH box helicase [Paraburkholderia hospita]
MLPSLLAKDIQTGLKQFLVSAFEPADAFTHGLMSRFVEEEEAWLKGPFVQVGLPFSVGKAGRRFFSAFETTFPGFSHQEQAWERLSSNRQALSTLVATGTGSGKTECFLYPVLDHCARARAGGEAGVKALVIYPMNALASDQARRIAELVASIPAFAGLRVGLYVGGNGSVPGEGAVMTPHSVITDRDTLRKHPPDILLTNYKMLDYLMLRPKDLQLWALNARTTLRYVVVDELHTFDGAQGTDLALLLRRLRARLKIPDNHLICAGTSATLGGASDTPPLRDYARQVFGVPFDEGAVVIENRQSVGAFLEDAMVVYMFAFRPELVARLDATQYASPEAAVAAWFALFFPDEPIPSDVRAAAWRRQLGSMLKGHQLFVNLLKLVKSGVVSYRELTDAFTRNMPAAKAEQVSQVIDALLVLVAWALRENNQPLVTLRIQLWVRELRRMVGKLSVESQDIRLRSERDLPGERDGVYLPMVQCNQCRTTGWLSRLVQGSSRLSVQLDEIYNTWFARRPEATRLYAAESIRRSHVEGIVERVCVSCGTLQQAQDTCVACGHQELLNVFHVTAQKTQVRGQAQFTVHDNTCPACGESDSLLLLGARNATLGSQVVESSWASVFNDDKKLIAFSDSVQDAAHRAGFFGARTYLNNVRTALAHVIDEIQRPVMPWAQFLEETAKRFDTEDSVLCMSHERLVAEFIAPNMTWQRDWSIELPQHQRLPAESKLPGRVKKRFLWQAYSELTYLSQRGRTLERIGKAVLAVSWEAVEEVAANLLPRLHEHYGARGLDGKTVAQWLWGMLTHMRRRGAVMHPELATYAGDGNVYALTRTAGRGEWLPKMGENTPRPVFLTLGNQRDFDKLTGTKRATWYDRWAEAVLGHQALLAKGMAAEMYKDALVALRDEGLLVMTLHHQGETWALDPDRLELHTEAAFIATEGSKRRLSVPRAFAEQLLGMPCLDAPESQYEVLVPEAASWWAQRFSQGDLRRVIAAEHTGLLERKDREDLESRFKNKHPKPWYENLLSATPTLEMGVDIGDLSSVLLCSVPPNQASFLQRIGRAGRRDGNALATTLADGNSPHDLYFFAETQEMLSGDVAPPGVFLKAAEVLRRQLFAFCMDDWVASLSNATALPEKTSQALDAMEQAKQDRFPYMFCDYVLQHEERLFQSFVALLAGDIDNEVRDRLSDFMQGQGDSDGLRARLLKSLEELLEERRSYKKRKDELDRAKSRLQLRPQDDATRDEIDQLLRERDKLLELIKEINGRDLLNTLTDAGLIPNYAFPEAGVELKSVLWRKRGTDEPGQGAYVTLNTLKYERPAQSALSEFAPENRFYANQRRVEVDQINMNLAKTESWRFCPSCHHMQNLAVEPDVHMACPRCGDAMWSDAAQRRTLLRFKQAIANSNDTEVRIDDSTDDREPRYYVRQLMADFSPTHVREAWQINTGELPFGFEFITRVNFRDVNFGELAKPGEAFKVADKESTRPGFRLCRHCGKVQKPPRRNGETAEQNHSFDCPKRGSDDPANLLECLYLYREFESEALRILVPYTRNGVDERVVQSFMAAVQLGLKKQFGGKVDHLRMVLRDEPGKDGGPRRHYVMLYDSVPGGTGYLHQLLAEDAGTLKELLRKALQAVSSCSCNADPEKDGCYRCVYQYRLGRSMELVSRDTAKAVLGELVNSLDELQRVETISDIYINPNFDSVLEARFLECLKRLGGVGNLPTVKLVQDVVNGKSGYVLQVGGQRYKVEPQCELGKDHGVSVSSKPDFVIWPWAASTHRRPIAVFCDGWAYHKESLREDALKRSAIVASGRFWVWSVTHNDVAAGLNGELDSDLESPLVWMARHDGTKAPPNVPRAQAKAFTHHAVGRLLVWLATPASDDDAALRQLQRNALWLGFLMVPHNEQERAACEHQWGQWAYRLPDHVKEQTKGFAPSVSKAQNGLCRQFARWPLDIAKAGYDGVTEWSAPGVLVLDDAGAEDEEVLHTAWRQWLHIFNTIQTLPAMWLVTTSGLDAHDYVGVSLSATQGSVSPSSVGPTALSGAWDEVLKKVLQPMMEGLQRLAEVGAPVPEPGPELANEIGKVVADGELCWVGHKLVVLREDQADLADEWTAQGWTALILDESMSSIGGSEWTLEVAQKLGLTMPNKD